MSEPQKRNPTWTRDELILVLEHYHQWNGNPPDKKSPEIRQLSDQLNALPDRDGKRNDKFRNANGVYMKLMNFRPFDPVYQAKGSVGLSRGGKSEPEIWNYFYNRRADLTAAYQAIISNVTFADDLPQVEFDGVVEAEEGRLLTRVHLVRERNRELVNKKKQDVLKSTGVLACEACGFDFQEKYGDRGEGFAEVHHIKPLHTLTAGSKTHIHDLAIVCANCHRMIHSRKPWLSIADLKAIIVK